MKALLLPSAIWLASEQGLEDRLGRPRLGHLLHPIPHPGKALRLSQKEVHLVRAEARTVLLDTRYVRLQPAESAKTTRIRVQASEKPPFLGRLGRNAVRLGHREIVLARCSRNEGVRGFHHNPYSSVIEKVISCKFKWHELDLSGIEDHAGQVARIRGAGPRRRADGGGSGKAELKRRMLARLRPAAIPACLR